MKSAYRREFCMQLYGRACEEANAGVQSAFLPSLPCLCLMVSVLCLPVLDVAIWSAGLIHPPTSLPRWGESIVLLAGAGFLVSEGGCSLQHALHPSLLPMYLFPRHCPGVRHAVGCQPWLWPAGFPHLLIKLFCRLSFVDVPGSLWHLIQPFLFNKYPGTCTETKPECIQTSLGVWGGSTSNPVDVLQCHLGASLRNMLLCTQTWAAHWLSVGYQEPGKPGDVNYF